MNLLDYYYKYWGSTDLVRISEKFGIVPQYIIEAGCHDGSDTRELIEKYPNARIFAFEPDHAARKIAIQNLTSDTSEKITIFDFGLSNENRLGGIKYHDGIPGTGSSQISESGEASVELRRLDDILSDIELKGGMLWLDVEGHAVPALEGMLRILSDIKSAKIEVQMHDMSAFRLTDYDKVINILGSKKLFLVSGPLNPGFFGDMIFVSLDYLNKVEVIKSRLLVLQIRFLHKIVYPALGKPKMKNN